MGIGGGGGNRQRGPVRSYVLYFERLTGWAAEGQGCGGRPVRGSRAQGVHWSGSQIETGAVPALRRSRDQKNRNTEENWLAKARMRFEAGGVFGDLGAICRAHRAIPGRIWLRQEPHLCKATASHRVGCLVCLRQVADSDELLQCAPCMVLLARLHLPGHSA
jgi:hypothetical protein